MFEFDSKINFQDKKNDILTVGELLIDMISTEYSDNFECKTYNKYFGGSPANIAMNVKRLGIDSTVASAVGKDGLGDFLLGHLEAAGIYTGCVQRVDYSTSMVLVTKSRSNPAPIFYRAADYHLEYTKQLDQIIKNSRIVHFSCWPISKEPSRGTILKVIAVAKRNDTLVCFDPNYHPMLWEKGEDGLTLIKELIGKIDIVKPSEDDAERLFGKDKPENQIKKFHELGAKLVVMTLGKDGVVASNGTEIIKLNTLATEVEDTTGAGDAYWSGFYTALVKGYSIREALCLGNAVSAYKLKFMGAVVDLPTLEELKAMYNL